MGANLSSLLSDLELVADRCRAGDLTALESFTDKAYAILESASEESKRRTHATDFYNDQQYQAIWQRIVDMSTSIIETTTLSIEAECRRVRGV